MTNVIILPFIKRIPYSKTRHHAHLKANADEIFKYGYILSPHGIPNDEFAGFNDSSRIFVSARVSSSEFDQVAFHEEREQYHMRTEKQTTENNRILGKHFKSSH